MEKIKSLLSGQSKDESKESHEGSHFANTRDPSSSLAAKTEETGMGLPIADQYAGNAATTGPLSGEESHLSGAPGSTGATGTQATGLSSTSGSTVPNPGAREAAVTASGVGSHERQTYPTDSSTSGPTGMIQDSRSHGAGITTSGTQHGSGKELGGAGAAGVTPGFAAGAHGQRDFPPSSNATGTSATMGTNTATTTSTHHPGRDAAAIGGAAVAGEGVHQHNQLSRDSASTDAIYQGTKGGTTEATRQPAVSDVMTKGPHSSNTANLLDPNIKSGTGSEDALNHSKVHGGGAEKADHDHKSDGTGSDAALKIGEVGTATVGGGFASHEYNKHRTGTSATTGTTSTNPNTTTGTASTQERHCGRDAAVGAGVGGAAYEADKHIKHDKDLTRAEKDAKKQHKHDEKEIKKEHKEAEREAKKEEKHGDKEEKKSGGLLSFLHRDKSKKYSAEDEAEFDRQEREHNSHAGRDAALGAGAVGTGGAVAYEANKHHGEANTQPDGITHGTPLAEKPVGKDYGDHLHGARNRGVHGSSGFPGTEGFGSDEGVIHKERDRDLNSGLSDSPATGGFVPDPIAVGEKSHEGFSSNTAYGTTSTTRTGTESHLGRDAAVGAGTGAVAGGIASHEHHRKHDLGYQADLTDRTATTKTNPDTTTTRASPAVADYPENKPQFGFGGDHTSSNPISSGANYPIQDGHSNPASSGLGSHMAEVQDGKTNRSHKEGSLPAGHSRSGLGGEEAHVPISEDAREKMIGEGKESMGRDTGVANPHEQY